MATKWFPARRESTMPRKQRRAAGASIALACLVLLCGRIWYVNETGIKIPVEVHRQDETVALDGAFAEYAYENTDGYSVTVKNPRRMSVNEYLEEYSISEEDSQTYLSDEGNITDPNAPTLVVVDLEIRNDKEESDARSEERGYLDSIGWALKRLDAPEYWIRTESSLLYCSLKNGGDFRLSIKPGTTYTIHVPLAGMRRTKPFPGNDWQGAAPELDAGEYEFVLTKAPVRKTIRFDVE